MNNLIVAEHFYSIQGEGKFTGKPAVFLRLAGCNLKCGFRYAGASWVCDSKEVWTKGKVYPFDKLIEIFNKEGYTEKIANGTHLIVTGGEPLLQQKNLYNFLRKLECETANYKEYVNNFILPLNVEIETNGTIIPQINLLSYVKSFNISPKLENSSEDFEKRKLKWFYKRNSILKFVISKESDLEEVLSIIKEFNVDNNNIFLMPSGETKEEIEGNLPIVAEICKKYNFNLSTRLHLHIWNKKTGV